MILANAVLQWIPGHETLSPSLIARLAAGGALAVQTPDNLDEPSHRLMREHRRFRTLGGETRRRRQGARRASRRRVVFSPAPPACAPRRRLAHHLLSPARRRRARGRRMAQSDGATPVPRPTRGGRARSLSLALRGGRRRGLSGGGGRDRAAALSKAILRRDASSLPDLRVPLAGYSVNAPSRRQAPTA